MLIRDTLSLTFSALKSARARTSLMLLAMAIGVASVVVLTSLGEGARRYITDEFASLGTNLLIVLPGRSETSGGSTSMFMSDTTRDLTLDDARALLRSSHIRRLAPVNVGASQLSWRERSRDVSVFGSSHDLLEIRHWTMAEGKFLPPLDMDQASPVCVIGVKLRRELFGNNNAIGQWVRLGDRRFRVIGVLATEGRTVGIDVEEVIVIPVASAQALFNEASLFRIIIEAKDRDAIKRASEFVKRTIRDRHQGEEDITLVTQDAVLATFDNIFRSLTYTVAGIAAISLAVAGILIMNVMLVSVSQRTAEIGILKALGASQRQIITLFLCEAAMLSLAGAFIGLLIGQGCSWLIGYFFPDITMGAPLWAVGAAIGVALITGLLFGAMPARNAARLDPVLALARR
jgi:putative ABC transport system permease protein